MAKNVNTKTRPVSPQYGACVIVDPSEELLGNAMVGGACVDGIPDEPEVAAFEPAVGACAPVEPGEEVWSICGRHTG